MSEAAAPRPPETLSVERLRQIVELLEEGVAVLGSDGVVEFINPSGEQILGVPSGQLLGWRLLDFRWEIVAEDGTALARESLPPLRALATGAPQDRQVVGMTSPAVEGTRWVEVSARPLHCDGSAGPCCAVASFRDISARRAAELEARAGQDRYRVLAQALPTGVFHVGADGALSWANDAMCAITGLSVEEQVGDGWAGAVHPEDRPRVMAAWARARDTGDPYILEHRILRPDGEVRWVVCRAAEHRSPEGMLVGYVGSVVDLSEIRAAGHMREQLIGLVSHELRAPLVAIRGGLGFLQPYVRDADEDGRRLYEIAVRNAELLERLVRDLLDIDRLEAGQLRLALDDLDLAEVVCDAMDTVAPLAEERGVTVQAPPVPAVSARADRDRLLQVVTNLLSNAVKFSEPGGIVRVELSGDGDTVVLAVHDQGRGVPAAFHERIFEPFGQVESADAAERGGAGLGLAISRAIVRRHGGRIRLESAPGQGASFFVELPLGRGA